ncbi:amino acid permease [Acinetobacter haemolyticus]|uniref:APC family permease n=1 Tax=Acinetobacter haemolyticus TaxID=29430 RepID=A0A1L6KKP0_ACIHA|nr:MULTISPECIES: APC family permease [Acinetobacter]APR69619.1 putrescine/spermidine ABC transporter [Acinetobacter haemolyticus]EEH70064.1 amino acid permease [Acinetobacter sp. ATCC 27244]NAR16830.1 amino acid permease [Acinetobacter haemolyticus]NAR34986.1 amino acid permease [Acinetobacter haemolyticus]NAR46230.1 amino acid permease [Acinetobacter haemolyticus]
MRITPLTTSGTSSTAKLQKTLGLWHIIIIGLAYIQPMTLFDTFGLVSEASHHHVPTSYIIALIAILLTSISYGHMIRRYPSSGSAYTYAQKSIHPNVGFMVGWSSWLDYLLSPMVNIILAVIYLTALFPDINHWVWVVVLSAFMTGVNLRGARFVANFNSWIVLVQLIVIAVFTYLVYSKLQMGMNAEGPISSEARYQLWSLEPFWNELTSLGALITGATLLCFSFTGFDSLSSLAEETKDTEKTLPRAIFLTALLAGIIFIISTYFIQIYFPNNPSTYFKDIAETQPEILLLVGGSLFQSYVLAFAIITVMASGISAHAGVSRLMYVMGRDGIINKKIFGHISPKNFTPSYNILIVGAVALTAGFMDLDIVISMISFGALTAFTFVNLSVISRYALRDGRTKNLKDIFSFVVIPLLGFLSVFAMWLEIEETALKYGLWWAMFGILYLGYKTKGFKYTAPQYNEFDDKH